MSEHFRTFPNMCGKGSPNMKANMQGESPPKGGSPDVRHGRALGFASPRSPLAPFAPAMRDADPDGAWRYASELFHEQGVIVLMPEQIERRSGWVAARMAVNLGENLFGKRRS